MLPRQPDLNESANECEELLREADDLLAAGEDHRAFGCLLVIYDSAEKMPRSDRVLWHRRLAKRRPTESTVGAIRKERQRRLPQLETISDPRLGTDLDDVLVLLSVRYDIWVRERFLKEIYGLDLGLEELGAIDEHIQRACSKLDIRGSEGRLYHAIYFST